MAYTKTNWQNGVTPVNADNMNKIENELEALDQAGGSGGGTQLYKHDIWVNNSSTKIYLIDTNESQYTALTPDFKESLAKNLKYIELIPTSFLPLFAELEIIREGKELSFILTTYYLQNKSFVSFNISSIDSDNVTPL